jgi:hypothetical protein
MKRRAFLTGLFAAPVAAVAAKLAPASEPEYTFPNKPIIPRKPAAFDTSCYFVAWGPGDKLTLFRNDTKLVEQDFAEVETRVHAMVTQNFPRGHRTTIRMGLPSPTWRKLYEPDPNRNLRMYARGLRRQGIGA